MTAQYHSKDRLVGPTHRLSETQPESPLSIALSHHAYSIGKAAALWIVSNQEWLLRILNRQHRDDGNSLTPNGGTD
jgi:hypothetical protein